MTNLIDLHVHSNSSDGTYSPSELVKKALKENLRAFALTDHDTTDGIDEALLAASGTCLEVIPGIEFSTTYEEKDIHMLGLGIDHHNAHFQESLEVFRNHRHTRNLQMIDKLREHGIDISYEKLLLEYPDCTVFFWITATSLPETKPLTAISVTTPAASFHARRYPLFR